LDEKGRLAIEISEQSADGEVSDDELRASYPNIDVNETACRRIAEKTGFRWEVVREAFDAVMRSMGPIDYPHAKGAAIHSAVIAGGQALGRKADDLFLYELRFRDIELKDKDRRTADRAMNAEKATQARLLRDIFGNPVRPVTLSPSWRTATVVSLAQQMYDARDFSAMPILADALQDAGCDTDDILDHCRRPGEHVRGCWAVDLVLGKT
jgi:hypothetical protein